METTRTNKSLQAMIFICLMLLPVCAFAEVSPVIGNFSVSPDILNDGNTSANICVETITPDTPDIGIVRVWAAVMPPGSETLLPADPMTYSPSIDLDPAEGASCKYQKLYTGFSNFGKYRVVVYAEDENGNISAPAIANLDQFLGTDVYEGEDVYEDDTFEHAKPIGVNEEIQRHNFDKAGDEDWIKFYGLPGFKYQIEAMNLGQKCDAVIELYGYDPDNVSSLKLLANVDDLKNQRGEFLIWDCTAYGFYYVKYSEAENKYGISTGYDIQISTPDAPVPVSINLPTFRVIDAKTQKMISSLKVDVVTGKLTIAEELDNKGTYKPVISEYPISPDVATVSISAPRYRKKNEVPINIDQLAQGWDVFMDPEECSNWYRDADNDGFGNPNDSIAECTQPTGYVSDNTDCNDGNTAEHPGQTWYKDADNDGISDGTMQISCLRPAGYKLVSELTATSGDCDDSNAVVQQYIYYRDADGDGFGNPNSSISACSQPAGYVSDNTDCNDGDALEYPWRTWYKDGDGDGYSDGTTLNTCARPAGYRLVSELIASSGDCNDNNAAVQSYIYYKDQDEDGSGNLNETISACERPSGYVEDNTDCDDSDKNERPNQVWYKDADNDGDSDGTTQISCLRPTGYLTASELTATFVDCDDSNAAIQQYTYCRDADSDGYGNTNEIISACVQPSGYVEDNTDCDDSDKNEHPNQVWYKDADRDNYSDGTTQISCLRPDDYYTESELTATSGDCDDSNAAFLAYVYYRDEDRDGFGNPNSSISACFQPSCGYGFNAYLNVKINLPTFLNVEINLPTFCVLDLILTILNKKGKYKSVIYNCHRSPDVATATFMIPNYLKREDVPINIGQLEQDWIALMYPEKCSNWYENADCEGFGNPNNYTTGCNPFVCYVSDNTDCNDDDENEYPGQIWYKDTDRDKYSDGTTQISCKRPDDYVLESELNDLSKDCDDSDASIYPHNEEVYKEHLSHAIVILQVLTGQTVDAGKLKNALTEADADHDKYLGVADIIHILMKISSSISCD
ncbi:MAG: hypothetical protein BWK80_14600 [Desulfobacteraceae bacterium IS3]|nr:MAG: hypothetical protein BWK80_14600 [Desulfobacteraceae bacterium IS3]